MYVHSNPFFFFKGTEANTLRPTSVHVLEGLLSLIRSLKLHIGITPGQVWVEPVHWHFNHFDFSISGKDFLDVVLCQKNKGYRYRFTKNFLEESF